MTPLEQALVSLASITYWLSWVVTILAPVVVIEVLLTFVVIYLVWPVRYGKSESGD